MAKPADPESNSNDTTLFEQRFSSKQTHKYMLNTFVSLLVLGFIHLPLNTYSLIISHSAWNIDYYRRVYMIIANLILIALYGFGLFVLDQKSRSGLLVFAWLVAVLDVMATVAVLFIFFVTIFSTTASLNPLEIFIGKLLFVLLSIGGLVIMAISVKHAFSLSKLMKIDQSKDTTEI